MDYKGLTADMVAEIEDHRAMVERKGAIVQLGYAFWAGDIYVSDVYTYRHMPERDKEWGQRVAHCRHWLCPILYR